MKKTSRPQRMQIYPDRKSLIPLAASEGEIGPTLSLAVEAFSGLIHFLTKEIEKLFTREEWNFMADANNGAFFEGNMNPALYILANCSDFQTLYRGGDRWLGKSADNRVKEICKKLHDLDLTRAWAVAWAIRFFWQNTEIDALNTDWWTIEFRARWMSSI